MRNEATSGTTHRVIWKNIGLLLLCLAVSGLASVWLGQDASWDIKNYHLYNAFAWAHDRLETDLYAVGIQTYFHPFLDIPYYLLAFGPLADHPKILAFTMGLPFGVLMFAVLSISRNVFAGMLTDRKTVIVVSLAATLMGVTGIAAVSQLGTTFNEVQIAALMLVGLAIVVHKLRFRPNESSLLYLVAGLAFGAAAGLKLTAAIYAPAIALAILFSEKTLRLKLSALVYFCTAWLGAFLLIWGWWAWKLFKLTGSPTFPMFNSIFHSPWIASGSGMDNRFKPEGLMETLFYPFYWMTAGPTTVAEPEFADPRFALGYVCFGLIVALLLLRKLKTSTTRAPVGQPLDARLNFILVFVASAYVVWQGMFSIIRYAIVVEALTGLLLFVLAALLMQSIRSAGAKIAVLIGCTAVLVGVLTHTTYPQWGRAGYGEKSFTYSKVQLPKDTLVLLASKPVGFTAALIGQENPTVRFVGLVDDLLGASGNLLQQKARSIIAQQHENIYVISRPEGFAQAKDIVRQYDKFVDAGSCQQFQSNIDVPMVLCKVLDAGEIAHSRSDSALQDIPLNEVVLTSGWSTPEVAGIWSSGSESQITLSGMPTSSDLKLTFRSRAFVTSSHPQLNVDILINGKTLSRFTYRYPEYAGDELRSVSIPKAMIEQGAGELKIRLKYDTAVSPASLGISADERVLGISLISLGVAPQKDSSK